MAPRPRTPTPLLSPSPPRTPTSDLHLCFRRLTSKNDEERSESLIHVDTSQRDAYRRQLEQANSIAITDDDDDETAAGPPNRNRRSPVARPSIDRPSSGVASRRNDHKLRDEEEEKKKEPLLPEEVVAAAAAAGAKRAHVVASVGAQKAHGGCASPKRTADNTLDSLAMLPPSIVDNYDRLDDRDKRDLHDYYRLGAAIDRALEDFRALDDAVRRRHEARNDEDDMAYLLLGAGGASMTDPIKAFYREHSPRPDAAALARLRSDFDAQLQLLRRRRRRRSASPPPPRRRHHHHQSVPANGIGIAPPHPQHGGDSQRPSSSPLDRRPRDRQDGDRSELVPPHPRPRPPRDHPRRYDQPLAEEGDDEPRVRGDETEVVAGAAVLPPGGRRQRGEGGADTTRGDRRGDHLRGDEYAPPSAPAADVAPSPTSRDFAAGNIQQQMVHLQRNYARKQRRRINATSPSSTHDHEPPQHNITHERGRRRRQRGGDEGYGRDRDRRRSVSRSRSRSRERRRRTRSPPDVGDERSRQRRYTSRRDSSPFSGDYESDDSPRSGTHYRRHRVRATDRGEESPFSHATPTDDYVASPRRRRAQRRGDEQHRSRRAPVNKYDDGHYRNDGGDERHRERRAPAEDDRRRGDDLAVTTGVADPTLEELKAEVAHECDAQLDSLSEVEVQRVLSMVQQMWDGVYTPQRVRKYLRNVVLPLVAAQAAHPQARHRDHHTRGSSPRSRHRRHRDHHKKLRSSSSPRKHRTRVHEGGHHDDDDDDGATGKYEPLSVHPDRHHRRRRRGAENANPEEVVVAYGDGPADLPFEKTGTRVLPSPDDADIDIDVDEYRSSRPKKRFDMDVVNRIVVHALGGQRAVKSRAIHAFGGGEGGGGEGEVPSVAAENGKGDDADDAGDRHRRRRVAHQQQEEGVPDKGRRRPPPR